jgi:phenylalanyl-tRNA synthetase beta chain
MRVPLSWLGEFVELPGDVSLESVHAALVSVGFEEEDVHVGDVTGPLVVGQVLEFTPEPQKNGKTINWCQVAVGPNAATDPDDVRGIVCGAHNFVVGDKVVVSLPGAVLPGPFPIAARKTYGHVSDGMIASTRELGLGDEHDGILVLSSLGLDPEVGTDAIALLGLDEAAVEINVTPDRGYAFSIRGVAREYSHATGATFRDPASLVSPTPSSGFSVVVDDQGPVRDRVGVQTFTTKVVRGIDATRPTPPWLASRLRLAGVRSISLPVDVTNYVMFELGQPIHGYDLDKVSGGLSVRRAAPRPRSVRPRPTSSSRPRPSTPRRSRGPPAATSCRARRPSASSAVSTRRWPRRPPSAWSTCSSSSPVARPTRSGHGGTCPPLPTRSPCRPTAPRA